MSMNQQQLRNALTAVEDAARARRNHGSTMEVRELFDCIARLTQLIREEIVK